MSTQPFPWRKTFILGFGVFGISIVWPIFNSFIPPMLEQLGLASLVIGFIMTWDSIINVYLTINWGETSPRFRARQHHSTSTPSRKPSLPPRSEIFHSLQLLKSKTA